jgi:hypothetical protein
LGVKILYVVIIRTLCERIQITKTVLKQGRKRPRYAVRGERINNFDREREREKKPKKKIYTQV